VLSSTENSEVDMKRRVAFFGVDRDDLKFIKFIQSLPEFEVALIADDRKDSAGIKYAEENQIRITSSLSDALKFQDIDIFAVFSPGIDVFRHIPQSGRGEHVFVDRKQFSFIYDAVTALISTRYSFVEEDFLANTKEIKKAISDFGVITKNIDILAINASIEAARAGESGKGFAVVASNIKDLVKSSREMLTHIKSILEKFTKTHQQMIDLREGVIGREARQSEND
jgi:methyl-accepting chemotaxis protein